MSGAERLLRGAETVSVRRPVADDVIVGGAAIGLATDRTTAFRRLADARLDDSYRLANAILANHADAEDAVHDAVVTAWRKWPKLRDPARFEAWFRRIVVNTCRDRLRSAAYRRTTDLAEQPEFSAPDGLQSLHDRLVLERTLARLKPDDRIVLALRYYRDLRVSDIAAVLDIPSGTATSRLRAAHARLKAELQRDTREGERE